MVWRLYTENVLVFPSFEDDKVVLEESGGLNGIALILISTAGSVRYWSNVFFDENHFSSHVRVDPTGLNLQIPQGATIVHVCAAETSSETKYACCALSDATIYVLKYTVGEHTDGRLQARRFVEPPSTISHLSRFFGFGNDNNAGDTMDNALAISARMVDGSETLDVLVLTVNNMYRWTVLRDGSGKLCWKTQLLPLVTENMKKQGAQFSQLWLLDIFRFL